MPCLCFLPIYKFARFVIFLTKYGDCVPCKLFRRQGTTTIYEKNFYRYTYTQRRREDHHWCSAQRDILQKKILFRRASSCMRREKKKNVLSRYPPPPFSLEVRKLTPTREEPRGFLFKARKEGGKKKFSCTGRRHTSSYGGNNGSRPLFQQQQRRFQ